MTGVIAASSAQGKSPAELHELARKSLQQKEHDAAAGYLAAALEKNINDATALSLMADVFIGYGDMPQAIGHVVLAVKADPENIEDKKKFLRLAKNVIFTQYSPDIEDTVLKCLETPDMECAGANELWGSTLLLNPYFGSLFAAVTRKRNFLSRKNPFDNLRDFAPLRQPFFLLGIQKIVLYFLQFERFITLLRSFLLERKQSPRPRLPEEDYLPLVAAVAHYSFNTDYILDVTEKEQQKIDALRRRIETDDAAARDALSIALLACYMPLCELKNADAVERHFLTVPDMDALVKRQITDYVTLQRRAQTVTAATPIDDIVSMKVKGQYETFPYPRWRELEEMPFTGREKDAACLSLPGAVALVAGCGTGMETSQLAAAYPKADIQAIDITRASLAYAMSKAEEYGLKNLTYRQADILKLDAWGRQFSYIRCAGVLHHMDDPEKGWAVLSRLLKPNGIMHIGLYSKMARRSIVAGREAIARGGYLPTPAGMRQFRKDSPKLLSPENLTTLFKARDYYHLNMYRDLLFHVHEDRFDIPRIKTALENTGLVFKGFKLPDAVMNQYCQIFPDDPAGVHLDNWHAFEQIYPDTFIHCYRFWCHKPAASG